MAPMSLPSLRQRGNNASGKRSLAVVISIVVVLSGFVLYRAGLQDNSYAEKFIRLVEDSSPQSTGVGTSVTNARNVRSKTSSVSANMEHFQSMERDLTNPLAVPPGKARNLPSIRVDEGSEQSADKHREYYGGKGDKAHLGGFTQYDGQGVSPGVWKHMVQKLNIKSVMDVGCGKGVSTLWFYLHGLDVLCVEGSHDAVQQTLLPHPDTQVVEHDYSRGPYWPEKTYDAAWAVEFLEHVPIQYHFNYISTFRKAAVLFVTSSRWGGWHHVDVHSDEWWIRKYEAYGFRYDAQLTETIRTIAENDDGMGPDGKALAAQHIFLSMKVFVNPVVASLPQHAHVFAADFGCYDRHEEINGVRTIINRECGIGPDGSLETKLPAEFYPFKLTPEQDEAWVKAIQKHIGYPKNESITK